MTTPTTNSQSAICPTSVRGASSAPTSKRYQGDLARREDPERWTPKTGAATRVQLGAVAVSAQPLHDGLIQSDKKIERPDLPAVSVPGDLQIHPRRDRLHDLLGLMREKHHRQRRIAISQRRFEIRPVPSYAGS